uniref:WW domain-containing protein n=1 Tax=Caenorhabditis tropicalis TaxID=1561998 RepID=A0A1I7UNW0_9PELO
MDQEVAEDHDERYGIVRVQTFGHWRRVESRSQAGRFFYYNSQTEVSQWDKPREWAEYEQRETRKQREKMERRERQRILEQQKAEALRSEVEHPSDPR